MNTQCFCCKKHEATNKIYTTNGYQFYCSTCLNNLLQNGKVVQAFDGNKHLQWKCYAFIEDVYQTYDNKYFLVKSYVKQFNYYLCASCNKLHSDKKTPNNLCPICAIKQGYTRCRSCGSWYHFSSTIQNNNNCLACINKQNSLLVNKYHASHNRKYDFIGYTGDDSKFKGLGFELEIDCFKAITKEEFISNICLLVKEEGGFDHCFIERDSSLLNGVELITKPHTKQALNEFIHNKMDKILFRLRNETPAEDCSKLAALHVHISKTVFGDTVEEQNVNIAKLLYWVSRNKQFLIKLGRRVNFTKCAFPDEALSIKEALEYVEDPESRYTAVNVCNTNTVEFRFMQTTTYTHILRALIDFCWHLATQISKFDWQDLDKNQILQGLPTSTQKYCQEIGLVINKEK